MFGPTNPAVWAPRGERVTIFDMDSTPAEVYDSAVKALLAC
jgi:hypothetical protein